MSRDHDAFLRSFLSSFAPRERRTISRTRSDIAAPTRTSLTGSAGIRL